MEEAHEGSGSAPEPIQVIAMHVHCQLCNNLHLVREGETINGIEVILPLPNGAMLKVQKPVCPTCWAQIDAPEPKITVVKGG